MFISPLYEFQRILDAVNTLNELRIDQTSNIVKQRDSYLLGAFYSVSLLQLR